MLETKATMAMAKKVVEEMCASDSCPRQDQHWHPLSVADLVKEPVGEYTITVRVRSIKPKGARSKRGKAR
jgi:hypothetical protein